MSKNEVVEGGIKIYLCRWKAVYFGKVFKLVHTDIVFGVLDRVVGQNLLNDFGRYLCHLWDNKGREICINFSLLCHKYQC